MSVAFIICLCAREESGVTKIETSKADSPQSKNQLKSTYGKWARAKIIAISIAMQPHADSCGNFAITKTPDGRYFCCNCNCNCNCTCNRSCYRCCSSHLQLGQAGLMRTWIFHFATAQTGQPTIQPVASIQ